MKICCIADIHVGVRSYSKVDPQTHFAYRELETLSTFKQVVASCIDNHIPILLIAGDIYHSSVSSPMLQDEVNKILYYASTNNIKVLILDGNHDLKKLDTAVSALKPVDTFELDNIIHTKDWLDTELTINGETVRFIFLPTYSNNQEIASLLDKHLPKNNKYKNPIITIGHFTMQGAALNDWLVAENEEYIDINNFKDRNISFVVLGHLHKPQVLQKENPFIFYTGSLQRIDFNEENQPKGYWILDTDDMNSKFIEMDMQKFYTVNCTIGDNGISTFEQIKKKIDPQKVNNAITRVIIEVAEHLKLTNDEEKDLNKYLQSLHAYSILAIKQKIIDSKRARNVELNETITVDKSLEIYYKDQPRADERIKLGKEIINSFRKLKE